MNDNIERFKKIKDKGKLAINASKIESEEILQIKKLSERLFEEPNYSRIDELMDINDKVVENSESYKTLLKELEEKFNQEKFDGIIYECKNVVLESIIKPFGISKIIFEDKEGGNITTINNFEKGVTATEEDSNKYQNWEKSNEKFDRNPYNKDFSKKRKEALQKSESIEDIYTGKELPKDGRAQYDHITSAREIEGDSKNNLFMNSRERVDMANSKENLGFTYSSANQSKSDKDLKKWANEKNAKNPTKTNSEVYGLNKDLLEKEYQKSKTHVKSNQMKAQIKKQGKEILETGAKEGFKMGLQQSLGLLLKEFSEAIFFEIKDIYTNGFSNGYKEEKFFIILRERLRIISSKILDKWENIVSAFGEGFVSGFFSNLITFIINSFKTTGKRMVKVIREGFYSFIKAIKVLLNPPEGFSNRQAAHESLKLLSAGIVTSFGLILEEGLEKFLNSMPIIGLIANIITPVIMGIMVGLLSILIVYMIDKADVFGVNLNEKLDFMNNHLDKKIEGLLADIEGISGEIENYKMLEV